MHEGLIVQLRKLLTLVLLVIVAVLVKFISRYFSSSARFRGLSLPPGPPRTWIIGNLLQMPKDDFVTQVVKWAREYGEPNRIRANGQSLITAEQGPIYYIQLPNKKFVFLNSAKVAFDLLESKSAIYSDRPRQQMTEMAGRTRSIFFAPFTHPRFKILRKLLQDGLNKRAVKTYRPIQVQENRLLLRALAESPNDFRAHIRRSVIQKI